MLVYKHIDRFYELIGKFMRGKRNIRPMRIDGDMLVSKSVERKDHLLFSSAPFTVEYTHA